jgi:hypothetical protein
MHRKAIGVANVLAALLAGVLLALAASAAPALAGTPTPAPWWRLSSNAAPTNLPLDGEGQLLITATDVGDSDVTASAGSPVTVTDELPPGVTPTAVEGKATYGGTEGPLSCTDTASTVSCAFTGTLPPYATLLIRVTLASAEPEPGTLQSTVVVQGGNAPSSAPLTSPLTFAQTPTPFAVEALQMTPEGEGGAFDAQAGSHPFQLTTSLAFDKTLASYATSGEHGIRPSAVALPRDLHFQLPVGLVGRVREIPQCSEAEFSAIAGNRTNLCPGNTALGVASVLFNDPIVIGLDDRSVPVFNLEPAPGEPARFGFEVENVPIVLKTAVPSGGEYNVEVSVENASQAVQVLATLLTVWGVPGEPSHDSSRGWGCLDGGIWNREGGRPPCEPEEQKAPLPFLTLPTSCTPLTTTISGDSWPAGEAQSVSQLEGQTRYSSPPLEGCDQLAFEPSIGITPEAAQASTPTGLDVGVEMAQPGLQSPTGLGESAVQATTVTLPAGLQLNPAAANGLQACSALQFGFAGTPESAQTGNRAFSTGYPECPDAAKVGTVSIATPLLPDELKGSLYLGAQDTDLAAPGASLLNSPLVLYLVAEDPSSGILVKLAGTIAENEAGQLVSTFENTPQLPFEALKLHFFGGPRASLSTAALCGSYETRTSFTPWSGGAAAHPAAGFAISSGPASGPCAPSPLSFSPTFKAGATGPQAGAFTGFTLQIERPDGQQALDGVTVRLPPGIAALLANVTPCPEPPAGQEWACGPASLIGHSSASSGLGGEPFVLAGQVYLTTGYDGAPFGLLVQTRALAGPFDLGMVNVRSRINVDRSTAAVTITTDPGPRDEVLPTTLKGVPVQLKRLAVSVDRPNFEFNPTNCDPTKIEGTLSGAEGASQSVSYPFQVQNCSSLPFHPTLTASTKGDATKANGASFTVKVTSSPGQANIAKTKLVLPITLPARLTTIQKACLAATFEANPAACPEGSNIGSATVHTPVLKNPLTGPAYLVSHGNAAFPDVEFVLQGEGITLILDGQTDIKKGVTTSTFNSVPDAPVTSFETTLPEGPHSALTSNVPESKRFSLCGAKLSMPTTITAQNGAVIQQQTKIPVLGCAAVKGAKFTRTQQLTKALKKCRKEFKHSKKKRASCERQARRRYRVRKHAAKKKGSRRGGHGART